MYKSNFVVLSLAAGSAQAQAQWSPTMPSVPTGTYANPYPSPYTPPPQTFTVPRLPEVPRVQSGIGSVNPPCGPYGCQHY